MLLMQLVKDETHVRRNETKETIQNEHFLENYHQQRPNENVEKRNTIVIRRIRTVNQQGRIESAHVEPVRLCACASSVIVFIAAVIVCISAMPLY